MRKTLGARLRGNAVAWAALFIALGGTAVAATQLDSNSVRSRHIVNNTVTGKDVREKTLKGVIKGKGRQVTNAASAQQGGFLPSPIPLVKVPGMGQVELIFCGDSSQDNQIRVRLRSNDGAEPFFGSNYVSASGLPAGTGKTEHVEHGGGTFADGGGEPLIARPGPNSTADLGVAAKWDFTFWRASGSPRAAHVTVSGLNGILSGNRCEVSAQGEIYG